MDTQEIRGEAAAQAIREEVRTAAASLRKKGITPRLAAVIARATPAVMSYAESKAALASELGVSFDLIVLPDGSGQAQLESVLAGLAADPSVHGIVLELPLGEGFDLARALGHIPAVKDVDGLTPANLGLLYMGREDEALVAATAQACVLLATTVRPLESARVGVVGRGRTVGAPLIGMLINRHATLTVCHSKTKDLAMALSDCEIIFSATGHPGLIGKNIIREGQTLIDAGIAVVDGKLCGDVDADAARGTAAAFTPVPQGVGPVTTALIFKNVLKAVELQSK